MNPTTSLDCRGLSCPEPVLRTARAARGLAASGGVVEIFADDDAFPADIQSWCRSAGAILVSLEADARGQGGHRALVQVAAKAKNSDANPGAPRSATAMSIGASGPTSAAATPVLDARGKQCPEPVLALARHARAQQGLVEVLADDDAFAADVEAWCRSAGATLLALTQAPQDGGAFRARIDLPLRAASLRGLTPTPPPAGVRGVPASVRPISGPLDLLDCRGKQCPEPVLALARHARAHGGGEVDVIADDPAFAADVAAWCRSSGATEISRTQEGSALRVRIRLATKAPSSRGPAASFAALDVVERTARIEEGAVRSLVPLQGANAPQARFDLRGQTPTEALAEAGRIGGLGAGMTVELLVPDGTTAQEVLRIYSGAGHEILTLELGTPARIAARLRGGAVTAGTPGLVVHADPNSPDCTLLVLHNDLEALLAALLVANGAAAAGMKVMIFFTFWGLNTLRGEGPNPAAPASPASFFQRVFKWMMPKGPRRQQLGQLNFGGAGSAILGSIMRQQNVSDLPSLLSSAQEQGVRFVACTMSMGVMGISKRDLHPYSNLEFAGVATFVDAAKSSKMSLVF
jgi:TusA-related sulfurtransferase/peroxiredoxin family protein